MERLSQFYYLGSFYHLPFKPFTNPKGPDFYTPNLKAYPYSYLKSASLISGGLWSLLIPFVLIFDSNEDLKFFFYSLFCFCAFFMVLPDFLYSLYFFFRNRKQRHKNRQFFLMFEFPLCLMCQFFANVTFQKSYLLCQVMNLLQAFFIFLWMLLFAGTFLHMHTDIFQDVIAKT